MKNTEWITALQSVLGVEENIDYQNYTLVLIKIFQGVIYPEITIRRDRVCLPERFSVAIGATATIYRVLKLHVVFLSAPEEFGAAFLDVLFYILRREVYDVIRFQCLGATQRVYHGLLHYLLELLKACIAENVSLNITKRIIHLIGIVGRAGINSDELRSFFSFLRNPSVLSISLLQALKIMIRQDNGVTKASPSSVFNFGGKGSGLFTDASGFLFPKEFQFSTWFRIENFCENAGASGVTTALKAFNFEDKSIQHIFTCCAASNKGIDVFLDGQTVVVAVGNNPRGDPTLIKLNDYSIRRGVWYHLCIKHSKPRLAIFGSDELSIFMDHQQVFCDSVRYSPLGNQSTVEFSYGVNLDGQLSAVYLFSEALPPTIIETLARLDAGKPFEGIDNGLNPVSGDLLPSIATIDKKVYAVSAKVTIAYSPTRCLKGCALDIHSGWHARFGNKTQAWTIINARDLFVSLGGLSCLYPLFPRLLVENDSNSEQYLLTPDSLYSPMSNASPGPRPITFTFSSSETGSVSRLNYQKLSGLGSSMADLETNPGSCLEYSTISLLNSEKQALGEDGCISLLLSILAKSITAHKSHQVELLNTGGIEMIEYVLSCASEEVFQAEGEGCVLSLIQLKSAAVDLPQLELNITKYLLCNISIWSKANFPLLSSLMSVVLAAIRSQPSNFLSLVGVQTLLNYVDEFSSEMESDYETSPIQIIKEDQTNFSLPVETGNVEQIPSGNKLNLSIIVDNRNDKLIYEVGLESADKIVNTARDGSTASVASSTMLTPISQSHISASDLSHLSAVTPRRRTSINRHSLKKMMSFKMALDAAIRDTEESEASIHDEALGSTLESMNESSSGNATDIPESQQEMDVGGISRNQMHLKDMKSGESNKSIHEIGTVVENLEEERESDLDNSLVTPFYITQTNEERKHLRECIHAMILQLILHSGSEKDCCPLLDFIVSSKDKTLTNEISQIILYLVAEGSNKMLIALLTASNGLEEFASIVLIYLIHQQNEELRYTGLRILTHLFNRVDVVVSALTNITLRKKKRVNTKLVIGLQRLQVCGGLSLICEVLTAHRCFLSEATYSALVEMLLLGPNMKAQLPIPFADMFECSSLIQSPNGLSSLSTLNYSVDEIHGKFVKTQIGSQLRFAFAADYLKVDQDENITNTTFLPIFLDLMPKIPVKLHEKIYSDLLTLLKHSDGNRDSFCSFPSWHLCMHGLVSQLVDESQILTIDRFLSSGQLVEELEKWTGYTESNSPLLIMQRQRSKKLSIGKTEGGLLRSWKTNDTDNENKSKPVFSYRIINDSLNTNTSKSGKVDFNAIAESSSFDTWFALGMKVYSTLLLHSLEKKAGWKELDRTISLSYDSSIECVVSQAVLSHLLNELTFNMKSRYREIQRLAKSTLPNEQLDATDRLENLLCVLLTSSQLSLMDEKCAVCGLVEFDIARQRVKILSELSKDLLLYKNQKSKEVTNELTSGLYVSSITPLEQRIMLENTEEKLKAITTTVENSFTPSNMDKYVELSYQWYDISAHEISIASSPSPDRLRMPSRNSFINTSSQSLNSYNAHKSVEELLHPLERHHDIHFGKVILVLQTLRYFDALFWPSDSAMLRNTEMLRFRKESETPVNTSQGKSSNANEKKPDTQLTIFSSAMRMCLFVLTQLSPITHLAVLNIKRIRVLLFTMDKVSQFNTPTHDWLLAAILHSTLGLQRIAHCLLPMYNLIGIDDAMEYTLVGPWRDSYDEFHKLSDEETEKFVDACGNNDVLAKLQNYFDSSPGRNLIRNIRISLYLLVDVFDMHHLKLASALEERVFRALYVLVEQIKGEMLTSLGTNSSDSDPSKPLFRPTKSGRSRSPTLGEDLLESSFSPNPISTSNSIITPSLSTFQNVGNQMKVRSISSEFGESAETFSLPETQSDKAEEHVEESFTGSDILQVMKWLRFPYFKLNPLRSVGLVKAVDALDFLETKNIGKFKEESLGWKIKLEQQRDISVRSVEEMTDLKELSLTVHSMMLKRYHERITSMRLFDNVKIKNVASRWRECIQAFESDWSPWSIIEDSKKAVSYEMSKFRDSKMRRMLLEQADEPIDHTNSAYLEGKAKDQLNYLAGITVSDSSAEVALPSANATGKHQSLKLGFHAQLASIAKLRGSTIRSTSTEKAVPSIDTAKLEENDDGDSDDDDNRSVATTSSGVGMNNMSELTIGLGLFFQGGDRRPQWTYAFPWATDERPVLMLEATQINLDQVVSGVILLTNKCLLFHARRRTGGLANVNKALSDSRWRLDRLTDAYGRRYLLQNSAIELYFADSPDVFLAFKSHNDVQKFFKNLRRQSTPLLATIASLNPKQVFRNCPWTEKWRKRSISNFEYLMRLNVIAGRSYNDITQYPTLPWVIGDYTSAYLDLKNPDIYRRLNLPVGALNPVRLKEFQERYNFFEDDSVPKFLYGSHYSSAGIVIHFMIRQEPFTTLAVNLQGGRFDCPDRIFFDVVRTWQGCNNSMSDVKELIPEMYCCPEALLNTNRLPLGDLQEGGRVDDVLLPPWADSAFDFVRINRDALESEYVSDHLHEWIDLIFGYKQVGQAASDSNNLFYYLTYENAINLEAIEDPLQREAAKAQVIHFGQTPSQLLTKEHPKRLPKDECLLPICSDEESIASLSLFSPARQQGALSNYGAVISIRSIADRLIVIHSSLEVCYYRWNSFPDGEGNPFTIRAEKSKVLPCAQSSLSEEILRISVTPKPRRSSIVDSLVDTANSILVEPDRLESIGIPADSAPPLNKDRNSIHLKDDDEEIERNSNSNRSSLSAASNKVFDMFRRSFKTFGSPDSASSPFTSNVSPRASLKDGLVDTKFVFDAKNNAPSTQEIRSSDKLFNGLSDDSLDEVPEDVEPVSVPKLAVKRLSHQYVTVCAADALQSRIVTCGYWDNSLKVHSVESLKEVDSCSSGHLGSINCVTQGHQSSHTLITGGQDGTCRIWVLEKPAVAAAFTEDSYFSNKTSQDETTTDQAPLVCVRVLWGHRSPVTSISYSADLDILLSGASDGLLCVHSVGRGKFIRSIKHMMGTSADLVLASSAGYLISHSWSDLQLHLFWLNGQHLISISLPYRLECFAVSGNDKILICGSNTGVISFREIWNLEELYQLNIEDNGGIKCLWFTEDNQFLMVGSEDGTFSIATNPDSRWKLLMNGIQKTPMLG